MIIIIEEGQTLIDLAIQEYGCIEGVAYLCEDNNFSLDETLNPAQKVKIRDVIPNINGSNIEVLNIQKSKRTIINSGIVPVQTVTPTTGFFDDDFYDTEFYD
jgi:hypothetical protein